MDFARGYVRWPSLRTTLALDAALEFVLAALLLLFAGDVGAWFGVSATVSIAAGAVFAAAGVVIAQMAWSGPPPFGAVRALAYANLAGGAAGWAAFFVAWPYLEPAGRGLLGTASDLFILAGVLELFALREQREVTRA